MSGRSFRRQRRSAATTAASGGSHRSGAPRRSTGEVTAGGFLGWYPGQRSRRLQLTRRARAAGQARQASSVRLPRAGAGRAATAGRAARPRPGERRLLSESLVGLTPSQVAGRPSRAAGRAAQSRQQERPVAPAATFARAATPRSGAATAASGRSRHSGCGQPAEWQRPRPVPELAVALIPAKSQVAATPAVPPVALTPAGTFGPRRVVRRGPRRNQTSPAAPKGASPGPVYRL